MKDWLSWKLTLFAVLTALGLFMSSSGAPPPVVEANVSDIDAQILVAPDGEVIEIIVDAEDDDGDVSVVITSTDGASNDDDLTLDTPNACEEDGNVNCVDGDATVDNEVEVESYLDVAPWDDNSDLNEPLVIDLELEVNCAGGNEIINVEAAQDGTSEDVDILCLAAPNITITKDADAAGDVEFEFNGNDCWASTPDDPGPFIIENGDTFLLANGESADLFCAVDETYFITENTTGWELTLGDCDVTGSADATEDEASGEVEIDLVDIDDTVECTFENALAAQGTITITKDAPGGTGTDDFTFTWSNAASCDDATSPFTLSEGESDVRVCAADGTAYVIDETAVETDWAFDNITCSGTAGILEDEPGQRVTITLDTDGETANCTFHNAGEGSITIEKEVVGGDGDEDFEFSITGDDSCEDASFILQDGEDEPFTGCLAGGTVYTVTEIDIPSGWSTEVNCVDSVGASSIEDDESVDITLTDNGADVVCTFTNTLDEGRIRIIKDADGGTASDDFDFEVSGNDSCDFGFTLSDGEEEELFCSLDDTYVVEETDLPTGWELTDITCGAEGDADFTVDEEDRSVTITLTDDADDAVTCTFYNRETDAVPSTSTTIDVISSSGTLFCSGTSFITAYVRTASGDFVSNGTVVVFNATSGSLSATSAGTLSGLATVVFTAPSSTGGPITITASSGGFSDSVVIQVNCLPQPPAAPTPIATQQPTVIIVPPSTGDAGLAAAGNGPLLPAMALAALASLTGAGLALARVRSR